MTKRITNYTNAIRARGNGEIEIALDHYIENEGVTRSEAIRNLLLIGFTTYYSYTTTRDAD